MTFTEDLNLNFPSMIAENFKVVLTKYIRIAADVFLNRVFKGNTVTDRNSAPYRTSISTQFKLLLFS